MSDPIWYRSLYFRIAFGFVALLATLLVLQGAVFLWMSGRMPELLFSRSAAQLADAIAADVAEMLADSSASDLSTEVNRAYSTSSRGFAVALEDGRLVESRRVPPPPQLGRSARNRLMSLRPDLRGSGREEWFRGGGRRGEPPGGPGEPGAGRGFGPGGPRQPPPGGGREGFGRGGGRGGQGPGFGTEFSNVVFAGRTYGVVAVPLEPPPASLMIQRLGPTLAFVAFALLVAGTAVGAFVIVGPTRRRLQELQSAARALGAGHPGARAPETGGDEVTALSHTFNEMASQLESRTRALEKADRTRRQLLADVSHELMTPLSAIRGYVETLRMTELPLDAATRQRYLGIVNEEAGRLESIIGDLLDLARLEGGGSSFKTEAVSLSQLLTRVENRHAPAVAERQITLRTTLEPGLTTVQGDGHRLEQALQNLVANAIRHTPVGGTVTVEALSRDDRVVMSVEDTGPGIPPEHLPHIFDRFYKVDESRTGTAVPSGSGLGLSIVQAIVARHGGNVSAANVPGAGARFEIVLAKRLESATDVTADRGSS